MEEQSNKEGKEGWIFATDASRIITSEGVLWQSTAIFGQRLEQKRERCERTVIARMENYLEALRS